MSGVELKQENVVIDAAVKMVSSQPSARSGRQRSLEIHTTGQGVLQQCHEAGQCLPLIPY